MILSAVAGLAVVLIVLWDAFETIVLPRRVTHPFRLTRLFYRVTWRPWRAVARQLRNGRNRETFLSFYGPLSLLFLFVVWAAALIFGFGLLDFSAASRDLSPLAFPTSVYMSGTTFFTLGLGDVTPHSSAERVLAVAESGLGFGFLALVLSYLPVIYQAFSRREVSIVLLDARAGSPPTATELLRRHTGADGLADLQALLREWERWSAEILESHVSYPAVSYFRSQHNNESWLAALGAILDASALLIASVENACSRQAQLTFAMCRHTVVDLAQVFNAAPRSAAPDRLPPSELDRLRTVLTAAGFQLRATAAANEKLAEMRRLYEPYLEALSDHLFMQLPPWILAQEITDNWRTSAWGRITGFSSPDRKPASPDDHTK
jgi:hypothetical protein